MGGGWLVLLLVHIPDGLRLPPGVWFGLIAVAAVAGATLLAQRHVVAALAVIIALVGWTQVGAPHYSPASRFDINSSPHTTS